MFTLQTDCALQLYENRHEAAHVTLFHPAVWSVPLFLPELYLYTCGYNCRLLTRTNIMKRPSLCLA